MSKAMGWLGLAGFTVFVVVSVGVAAPNQPQAPGCFTLNLQDVEDEARPLEPRFWGSHSRAEAHRLAIETIEASRILSHTQQGQTLCAVTGVTARTAP